MTATGGRVVQGRTRCATGFRSVLALEDKGGRSRVEFFRRRRVIRFGRGARGRGGDRIRLSLALFLGESISILFVIQAVLAVRVARGIVARSGEDMIGRQGLGRVIVVRLLERFRRGRRVGHVASINREFCRDQL